MFPFPVSHWGGGNAVDFDAVVGDYLERDTALVGAADSKKLLVSGWFRLDSSDNTFLAIFGGRINEPPQPSNSLIISRVAFNIPTQSLANRFRIDVRGVTGAAVALRLRSTGTYTAGTGWHHFLASSDQGVAGSAKLYMDDVDETIVLAAVDVELDFTTPLNRVASGVLAGEAPGWFWPGCLAELYINFGAFLDLTVEANRRKFITASLKPVDLGADGSTPTGVQPILYFSGDASNFHLNKGSGGGFVKKGAPKDCSTEP